MKKANYKDYFSLAIAATFSYNRYMEKNKNYTRFFFGM